MNVDYSSVFDAVKRRMTEHQGMVFILEALVSMADEKVTTRRTHEIASDARAILEAVKRGDK